MPVLKSWVIIGVVASVLFATFLVAVFLRSSHGGTIREVACGCGVDLDYWFNERPFNVAWMTPESPHYVHASPFTVVVGGLVVFMLALSFASWSWSRWRGPIVID